MGYDDTFIKELRGLGEFINSLEGGDKIIRIVERCIEIKRQLNQMEKRMHGMGNRNAVTERKKEELLNEYFKICHGGTKETRAVRELALFYDYFIDSLKIDYQNTIIKD